MEESLLKAANIGYIEVCKKLIKRGVNINEKNEYGNTPLMLTCMYRHKKICLLLLENGADVNIKDNVGRTALMHAVWKGYKEICSWLLENGADVNIKDSYGETALINASEKRYKEICSLLIENKADINIGNIFGDTLFMLVCSKNLYEVSLMLIKKCVNINEKNNSKQTPLEKASHNLNREICILLISSGCNYSKLYKKISHNKILEIPSLRTLMIENVKNQKNIKLSELIDVVPEEILDDINNKSISYCSKCQKHFYYYKYNIKLKCLKNRCWIKGTKINIKCHCL